MLVCYTRDSLGRYAFRQHTFDADVERFGLSPEFIEFVLSTLAILLSLFIENCQYFRRFASNHRTFVDGMSYDTQSAGRSSHVQRAYTSSIRIGTRLACEDYSFECSERSTSQL